MVRIHHAPGVTGTFTDDEHGTFDIDDGIIECDDAETAAALVDGHRRLSWADGPPESDATPGVDAEETGSQNDDIDAHIDAGVCPWCDEYEGDYLGQHASSAHPDEWAAYSEG